MRQRRARVLTPGDVCRLLDHVAGHRHALRDKVLVLLSFKAGLRACEIAGLNWDMVLATDGTIDDLIGLAGAITKGGRARVLPMHPQLKTALRRLHRQQGRPAAGPIVRSERGRHMTARSIVNWFAALYRELELLGCSPRAAAMWIDLDAAARDLALAGWRNRPLYRGEVGWLYDPADWQRAPAEKDATPIGIGYDP